MEYHIIEFGDNTDLYQGNIFSINNSKRLLSNNVTKSSIRELNLLKDKTVCNLIIFNNVSNFTNFSESIFSTFRLFHKGTIAKFMVEYNYFNHFNFYKKYFNIIEFKFIDNIFHIECKINEEYLVNYNKSLPTIITSFYDIRSLENGNISAGVKKLDTYLNLSSKFILSLEYPLIIYTEEKLVDKIWSIRPKEYHNITTIISKPLSDIYYYKYVNKIKELQNSYIIKNRSLEKDTPFYTVLVNNKFWFIEDALELNPYNSEKFLWMDFGINHVAENTESIRRWFRSMPDKIRCLEVNLNFDNNNYKEYFTEIRHNVAGGIISGTKENMLKYIKLCQDKCTSILDEEWYQLEEAIMGMVTRDNPDLFDNFYGSFNNYIIGYDGCFELQKSWTENTLFHMITSCLNNRNYLKCQHILNYMKTNYLYGNKKGNYIKNYIICNFYINKTLNQDIINSLSILPLNIKFIQDNLTNLKFYINCDELIELFNL